MEFFLEVILQCFFEFVLQLIAEVLGEVGSRSCENWFKQKRIQNPWLAGAGYLLLGVAIGAISLIIFKNSFIQSPAIRLANLFLTPALVGGAMAFIGWLRSKNDQELVRLDRFGYGFLFAFGMALVRYIYAFPLA